MRAVAVQPSKRSLSTLTYAEKFATCEGTYKVFTYIYVNHIYPISSNISISILHDLTVLCVFLHFYFYFAPAVEVLHENMV